ncbi:sulfite exporter TauE/SafE family protein [Facilibium subflavum]|uniref:sulfite exporter TauE/SafE family protein n=1 Tax=Facilibium subflavum TaxID=2219058 RepID=UPI000E64B6C3|nr:sulfite exporter TauE/SafE family protein [Facilibium subflavum]
MALDVFFIFSILIAGGIAGFASGLFGIGGGVVLVPVLIVIFEHFGNPEISTHTAICTSLAIIIPNALISSIKQIQANNLDLALFKRWMIGLLIGIVIGALLMLTLSGIVLKILFLCLLIFSLFSLFGNDKKTNGLTRVTTAKLTIGSTVIAAFSVLLGVGGGTFTVPYCKKILRLPIKKAIAISSLSGLFIGTGGTIIATITGLVHDTPTILWSLGYLNWIVVILVLPTSLWLTPKGVMYSHKLSEKAIKYLFILLLCLCILIMLVKIF